MKLDKNSTAVALALIGAAAAWGDGHTAAGRIEAKLEELSSRVLALETQQIRAQAHAQITDDELDAGAK